MRRINEIFVHCDATLPGWMDGKSVDEKVYEIDRWHKARGWRGFGYHYYIDRNGEIATGRPKEQQGAHVYGRNENSLGVCIQGGHGSNEQDRFEDHYTPQQNDALRSLLSELKGEFPKAKIRGHNEVSSKACPGFNVQRWLRRQPPRKAVESTTMQASIGQVVAGGGTAFTAATQLDGAAQIVLIVSGVVIVLLGMWIFRERLQKWAKGVR